MKVCVKRTIRDVDDWYVFDKSVSWRDTPISFRAGSEQEFDLKLACSGYSRGKKIKTTRSLPFDEAGVEFTQYELREARL